MTVSTPTRRRLPFLSRNWNQGVSSATSGARSQPRNRAEGLNGIDANHEDRPLKRPRLSGDDAHDAARCPARNVFPPSPPNTPRSLRINVLRLAHKDSERRVKKSRTFNNIDAPTHSQDQAFTTRASCRITILDNSPLCAHMPPVVYCTTQDCTIKTFRSPFEGGYVARIYLDEPFDVPEKNLKVIREDNTRGLAESYRLDVELYAGDWGEWPPVEVSIPEEHNTQGTKRWVLLACLDNLFERRRSAPRIFLHQYIRQTLLGTDFVADIDARWSTGLEDRRTASGEEMMPSITVADADVVPAVRHNHFAFHLEDALNGDGPNGSVREMSEELDGETTPNRALRTRVKTSYNLKQLSDKAHGRKKKKSRPHDDGLVAYIFPDNQVALDSYQCVACGKTHDSIKELRLHLVNWHPSWKYVLRSTNGMYQFHVTFNYELDSPPPEEFQFTKPPNGLDIDELLRGRMPGREEETVVQRLAQPQRRPVPKKPRERRKVLVPKTGQPMYDPVSRAMLEPGTELVPPKADHAWRIQLHRDNIADYVDIPSPEREYISAWDAFCLPRGLSSEVYLPEALMEYTREKSAWLVSSGQRMEEFLKHMSSLQLRGVLDQGTKEEVLGIIGEARGERERAEKERESGDGPEPMDEDGPVDWQAARKAENCAVCAQSASSIVCVLVCSNPSCKRRYHLSCIRDDIKMDPLADEWLCNDCAPEEPRVRHSPVTA